MQLPEGLGLYWRDNETVQLGLSPARSAVFSGLYPREIPLLSLLRNSGLLTSADGSGRGSAATMLFSRRETST